MATIRRKLARHGGIYTRWVKASDGRQLMANMRPNSARTPNPMFSVVLLDICGDLPRRCRNDSLYAYSVPVVHAEDRLPVSLRPHPQRIRIPRHLAKHDVGSILRRLHPLPVFRHSEWRT